MRKNADKHSASARERRNGDNPVFLTRWRQDFLQSVAASRFYRHTLVGRVPVGIGVSIAQPWPGDPKRGLAIVAGDIRSVGILVPSPVFGRLAPVESEQR